MDTPSSNGQLGGEIVAHLSALRARHAEVDRQIQELQGFPAAGREIAALKVEKLWVKDQIARLTH